METKGTEKLTWTLDSDVLKKSNIDYSVYKSHVRKLLNYRLGDILSILLGIWYIWTYHNKLLIFTYSSNSVGFIYNPCQHKYNWKKEKRKFTTKLIYFIKMMQFS